jgi:hypothetical protein
MGTKLSIDKTVSELDDILSMNPTYFKKVKFEHKSPQGTAHHLKVNLSNKAMEIFAILTSHWRCHNGSY